MTQATPMSPVTILDRIGFPRTMHGLRVLDVGCSDGYFSFEMEKRGVNVVAIDFVPRNVHRIFDGEAHPRRLRRRMDNIYNVSPEHYGNSTSCSSRATAIDDPLIAKYQRLDTRLQKTAWDPSVPYLLDEQGSVHTVVPLRSERAPDVKSPTPGCWWRFWRRDA